MNWPNPSRTASPGKNFWKQLAALDEADITDDDLATAAGGAGPIVESNALTKKTESGIQIIRSKGVPDVTIFSGEPAGELKLTNMGNETVLKSIKNALP